MLEEKQQWSYNARGQVTASCELDPADPAAMAYTCSATTAPAAGAKVRRTVTTYCEAASVTAGTCPREGLVLSVNGARPASDTGMVAGQDDLTRYTYRQTEDPTCATNGACTYRKGDLWKVTNALGQVTETVSYDKNGRVTRVKDANGTVTDFTYHPRGWLLSRTVRADASGTASAGDATTGFLYDNVGQVTRVTQPDGSYLGYAYDAAHRLLKITDNAGNAIDYCPGGVGSADCLDAAGNRRVERITDPSNTIKRSLRRTYNQLSQLTSVLNAQSQATLSYPAATGYDANGNPTHSEDGLGVETQQEYDPLNRLKKTIQDYAGSDLETKDTITQYAYDTRDNLRSVTDPENLITRYDYDGLNNLTGLHSPDTGTISYTYDAAGNRRTQTDARLVTSNYSYDALNRLIGITYPDTSRNVVFHYDQRDRDTACEASSRFGRLTTMTDGSGSTVYCYDRRGNVTRKTQTTNGVALVTAYTYTLADRLATITYPSGGIATYGHNALGQVTSLTWKTTAGSTPVSVISSASYYPFGPLNVLTYGNGRTLTKTYDQDYAIDTVTSSDPNGLVLDLTTDVMGNITEARDNVAPGVVNLTRNYVYDSLYRLSRVNNAANAMQEDYAYTKTGDRTLKQFAGQAAQVYATVANSHRLGSVNGIARAYDANGNTTTLPNVPYPLVYDDRNRLASVTLDGLGGAASTMYSHNGRGERVRKVTGGTSTTTQIAVYDEAGKLLRERADRVCGGGGSTSRLMPVAGAIACGGNRTAEILYLDDLPVAQVTDGAISYLETDHLGTPRIAANPSSNAWQWKWGFFDDAFGGNAVQKATSGGIDVNLRYPGQYYDEESGLHYNYFRDYEPGTGRYIESDPIGLAGGVNTFSYADASALSFGDPFGLVRNVVGSWISTPRLNLTEVSVSSSNFVPVHWSWWGYVKFLRINGSAKGFINIDVKCKGISDDECLNSSKSEWYIRSKLNVNYSGSFDWGPNIFASLVGLRAGVAGSVGVNVALGGAAALQAEYDLLVKVNERANPFLQKIMSAGPTGMCLLHANSR